MNADADPDPATVVRTLLESYKGTVDWETWGDCLHEDVVFKLMFPVVMEEFPLEETLGEAVHGRDAVRAFNQGAINTVDGMFSAFWMHNINARAIAGSDEVVCEYESEAPLRTSDRVYRNVYVGLFVVRNGKITSWKEYANPDLVRRALLP